MANNTKNHKNALISSVVNHVQIGAGIREILFTHAQDTLMTIMSEVNLAEKMILVFESFYKQKDR